jgi:hypothetical protein
MLAGAEECDACRQLPPLIKATRKVVRAAADVKKL